MHAKIDFNDTIAAMLELKPGERTVYYTGDLAWDRVANSDLRFLADTALGFDETGIGFLTRRRPDQDKRSFEYCFTASTPSYALSWQARRKIARAKPGPKP